MADKQDGAITLESLKRELEMLSRQNTAMFEKQEEVLSSFRHEFAYLNQQNLSVYNMSTAYVQSTIEKVQKELDEKLESFSAASASAESSATEPVVDYERIIDGVAEKLSAKIPAETKEPEIEEVGFDETIDYEQLSEKIAENIPPVDYDYLACKIANNMTAVDYDNFADVVAEKLSKSLENVLTAQTVIDGVLSGLKDIPVEVDTEALANDVSEKIRLPENEIDYDELAGNIASRIDFSSMQPNTEELADAVASKIVPAEIDAEEVAECVISKMASLSVEVDYEAIADKILATLPDAIVTPLEENVVNAFTHEGADAVAEKVAEKLQNAQPSSEVEEVATRVVEKIGVLQAIADSDEIAEKVVAAMVKPDYDEIADRLAEKLNGSEEEVEEYLAERGIELDDVDYSDKIVAAVEENSGKTNALVEEVIELLKNKSFVSAVTAVALTEPEKEEKPADKIVEESVAEEPVQELVDEPVEETKEEEEELPVQELVDEPVDEDETAEDVKVPAEEEPAEEIAEEPIRTAKSEVSIAAIEEATRETAALTQTAQELGKTVRLKRSYECKLRQSSDDIKYYYSEIKNELLSYAKVKSGISWNGDRFNYGRETIAKININGKTLCVYLALNPDEYSITKYHHKYVGDVKAYESTPMLVKVKSNMGLKKAISLVYEMMEGLKAQRIHKAAVDYVAEYEYKSDEQMIAEGLIKASMTEKKDLNSF